MSADSNNFHNMNDDSHSFSSSTNKMTLRAFLFPGENGDQKAGSHGPNANPSTMPLFSSVIGGGKSYAASTQQNQRYLLNALSEEKMSRVDSALSLTASSVPTTGAPNSVFSMTSDPIISSQTHQGMLRMERNMDDMSPGDYGMQNFMRMFRACQNGQMPHMNIIGIHVENTGIPILRQEASIHQNFAGPFAENTMLVHPQIADTPKEYQFSTKGKINLPPLNVNKLPDETLLYMYYNFPKEAYQSLAVHMLQKRGWLYHKRAQGWVRRIITKPPAQITPELGADEGIFAFFNPMTWRSENKRLKIANEEFERFGPISENLLHFYRWKQYETLIPVETRGDTLPQPQQVVAVTPTSEI